MTSATDATSFLEPGFVHAWYSSYCPDWEPVLLLQHGEQDDLTALWALAQRQGQWVVAGAHQAEYQGWLAHPQSEADFLRAALDWLTPQLGKEGLRIKYLVSAGRAAALQSAASGRAHLRRHVRPLMRLDAQEIRASLAKKGNKSRFNRLARLGDLRFDLASNWQELDGALDALIAFYDLRQGAVNHSTPFREDPVKRDFHHALFDALPEERVVMVASLGGQPIAGFWGLSSRAGGRLVVHLGMLMHSPMLAEHSPGKLLLMRLSEALVAKGVHTLDLSPGGDPWKERFANDHDEVFELLVYRDAAGLQAAHRRERRLAQAKRVLAGVGLAPERARALATHMRKLAQPARWAGAARRMLNWLVGERREYRLYRLNRAQAAAILAGQARRTDLRVNAPAALLGFVPRETWQDRQAFWSQALARLEAGHQVYTLSGSDGDLQHFGWLAFGERQSRISEVGQTLDLPEGSATLYDFYTDPQARGQGAYRASLRAMLEDAFARPDTRWAYIGVLADNLASRHVIESTGFQYQGSLRRQARWGGEHHTRDATLLADATESVDA
ncbi:MAG: GNAT family N-acetyltransferase [Burkholderiales bacterium]|nr:GNAT family N-acetyltransferase [Burkholderiales bacterium]